MTINDCYELAFAVCLILLALFCRKMFRSAFAKLKGGKGGVE